MRLSDYIIPECVKIGLDAEDKSEVIEELVEVMADSPIECDAPTIHDAVLRREDEGSTGLEKGIAIPHAKCDAVKELSIVIGISKDGIEFDSQDGKPAHLFFMMIAPTTESGPHVQAIAKIIKMIKMEGFRKKLLNASSGEEVIEAIRRLEEGEE